MNNLNVNEKKKDFSDLFIKLSLEYKKEVIDFMEFLYLKTVKETNMESELREELLERKKEGLENLDRNFPEEEVFKEMEALFEI